MGARLGTGQGTSLEANSKPRWVVALGATHAAHSKKRSVFINAIPKLL